MKIEWTYKDISEFSGINVNTLRNRAKDLNLKKLYAERKPISAYRQRIFDISEIQKLIKVPAKVEIVPCFKKAIYTTQSFHVYESKINQQ